MKVVKLFPVLKVWISDIYIYIARLMETQSKPHFSSRKVSEDELFRLNFVQGVPKSILIEIYFLQGVPNKFVLFTGALYFRESQKWNLCSFGFPKDRFLGTPVCTLHIVTNNCESYVHIFALD